MACTAVLLLVFVWDKTASGTVRSILGNGMNCIFSVLLLAVQEVVSSHTKKKTRSRSAVQSILSLAPCCPRGSLVPYKSEEHQFCGALLTERTVCGMVLLTLIVVQYHSQQFSFLIINIQLYLKMVENRLSAKRKMIERGYFIS